MRIVSWNLNGLATCVKNDYFDPFYELLPDVICCQETKTAEELTVIDGYRHYYLPACDERYCGNLIMTLEEPLNVICGMNDDFYDEEPRVLTVEYPGYYIVNTYVPSVVDKLERRIYRIGWSKAYKEFAKALLKKKPVILCGDFNVSLSSLDYYDEDRHKLKNEDVGFESDERTSVKDLLKLGLADAYRQLYPTAADCYTRWANKGNSRARKKGSRLDYFFVSDVLIHNIKDVLHHTEIQGSDHCPIELILQNGEIL
jgi:exodeoxyribonuclease-3